MAMVEICGKQVYVETFGKKEDPALVFFHGGPGDGCEIFLKQAQLLGEHFFMICYDNVGCMNSEGIAEGEPFGLAEHLEVADCLRKKLGLSGWSIYGKGFGAVLACLYASRYPEATEKVIYDCPSWNFIQSAKSIAAFLYRESFIYKSKSTEGYQNCTKLLDKDYSADGKECVEDTVSLLRCVEDKRLRFYLHKPIWMELLYAEYHRTEEAERKERRHIEKMMADGKMFEDFLPLVAKIAQPSLLIVGKHDPICTLEQRRFFVEHAPNGEIAVFQNSGSFPHIEEQDEHLFTVVDFIKNRA